MPYCPKGYGVGQQFRELLKIALEYPCKRARQTPVERIIERKGRLSYVKEMQKCGIGKVVCQA